MHPDSPLNSPNSHDQISPGQVLNQYIIWHWLLAKNYLPLSCIFSIFSHYLFILQFVCVWSSAEEISDTVQYHCLLSRNILMSLVSVTELIGVLNILYYVENLGAFLHLKFLGGLVTNLVELVISFLLK